MATRPLVLLILAAAAFFGLAPCTADNSISSPNALFSGQSLIIGNYKFIMQYDCNLVLYDSNNPIWASDTERAGGGCKAVMQNNGNLVIIDNKGNQVWESRSAGTTAHYVLVLQRDRNVVIYGPNQWATNTNIKTIGVTVVPQNSTNSTVVTAAADNDEQVIVSVA